MTQVFMLFLKYELTPIERKAFLDGINRLLKGNIKTRNDIPRYSKTFVETLIAMGFADDRWDRNYCSSLNSFMRYLLKYRMYTILGDSRSKNPYIAYMDYDKGKLGYREFHIKLYCDKWKKFLEENIVGADRLFKYYLAERQTFELKTNRYDG